VSESKDEKRTWLMKTAIDTIGRYGIKKTTLDDIAKAAGMATPSLYYYFPNKNELLRMALSSVINTLLAEVEGVTQSSKTPEKKLVEAWRIPFTSAKQSGFLMNLDLMTKSEVLHIAQDLVEDFHRRYTALIRSVLEEGKVGGFFQIKDLDLASTALSIGFMGLLLNTAGKAQFDLIDQRIDELAELIMAGLSKR
jgi:AcrR family transcriptional regulator